MPTRRFAWITFIVSLLPQPRAEAIPCVDYESTFHWASIIPTGYFVNMDFADPILYVGESGSIQVFHLAEPAIPTLLCTIPFPGEYPAGFRAKNNLLLTGTDDRIMRIYDVENPAFPTLLSSVVLDEEIYDIEMVDRYAYASTKRSLIVIDLLLPENPSIAGSWTFPQLMDVRRLAVAEQHAYVMSGTSAISILDVSDALHPVFVNEVSLPGNGLTDVETRQDILYGVLGDYEGGGLAVVDISNPLSPQTLSFLPILNMLRMAVSGDIAFASDWANAIVLNVSVPSDPQIVLKTPLGGQFTGFSVIASPRLLLVSSNPEGIGVAETKYLDNPEMIASLDFIGEPLDVHVAGNLGLVTMNPSALKTISLDDPANPSVLGSVGLPINMSTCVTSEGMIAYAGTGSGPQGGLTAVDISNPAAPFRIESVFFPQLVNDVDVRNGLVAASIYSSGFALVDFSNPHSPQVLSTLGTPTAVNSVKLVSETLLLTAQDDRLNWFDIQDPSNPILAETLPLSSPVIAVEQRGELVVALTLWSGLWTVDGSGSPPSILGSIPLPAYPRDLVIRENLVYVSFAGYETGVGGIVVIDVTYPEHPRHFGMLSGPCNGIALSAGNGFLCGTRDSVGIAIFPMQCETTPVLVSSLDARWNGWEIELSWTAPWADSGDLFRVFRGFSRFGPFSPRDLPISQRNGKFLCIDDESRPQTTYAYKLQILDQTGDDLWAGPVEVLTPPQRIQPKVSACTPNPFRQSTSVQLILGSRTQVRFEIYDTAGRKILRSPESLLEAGTHDLSWNGTGDSEHAVGAGVYWMKIVGGSTETIRKVVKLR